MRRATGDRREKQTQRREVRAMGESMEAVQLWLPGIPYEVMPENENREQADKQTRRKRDGALPRTRGL